MRLKLFRSTLIIFLFLAFHLEGTVFFSLDTTCLLKVELSSRFQNRIYVDGSRISKVVYSGEDLDVNLDNLIGQVFVYSLVDFPEKSSITIITEEGEVQDIEISFKDKEAEIVVLEPYCFEEPTINRHPDYRVRIIEDVLAGRTPEEYVACDFSPEVCQVKKDIFATLTSKLVSLQELVTVCLIENTSRYPQMIYEQEIQVPGAVWIYIDKHQLAPGEQTIGIVGVKNSAEI